MVFYQASAPMGWTQDTTSSLDGRALRVETGQGGGSGGSHDLASPPSISHSHSVPSHSHTHSLSAGAHTLTISEMPIHNHSKMWYQSADDPDTIRLKSRPGWYTRNNVEGYNTGSTGGSTPHSHGLSGSITSASSGTSGTTTPTTFAPKYVNVIICTKD